MDLKFFHTLFTFIIRTVFPFLVFSAYGAEGLNPLLKSKFGNFQLLPGHYTPHIDGAVYYTHGAAGQVELFAPIAQLNEQMLYTNFRYFDRAGPPREGNISLGYRGMNKNLNQMLGLYSTFDRKRSGFGNYFNQITLGGEWWRNKFFLGGNVYFPLGETEKALPQFNSAYLQNFAPDLFNIYVSNGHEISMHGFDAQLGFNVFKSLTLYAGGYSFMHSNSKTVTGGRARANFIFYNPRGVLYNTFLLDRISVETNAQYDNVENFQTYIGLRLIFNLDKKSTPSLNMPGITRHMVDPIYRDLDVVTSGRPAPPQPLMNDQGLPLVVGVANQTEAKLNALINNPAVDVVVLNGSIEVANNTPAAEAKILNHDVYITGGHYSFVFKGQPYTLGIASTPGVINIVGLSNANYGLFQIKGERTITMDDITLNAPLFADGTGSGYRLIFNDPIPPTPAEATSPGGGINSYTSTTGNLGSLTLNNIETNNGRIILSLNGPSVTGMLSVTNNHFDLGTTSLTQLADDEAALVLFAQNQAVFSVSNFSNNLFSGNGRGNKGSKNIANKDATINFLNGVKNNTFSFGNQRNTPNTYAGIFSGGMHNEARDHSLIEFSDGFMGNNFSINGSYAFIPHMNSARDRYTSTFNEALLNTGLSRDDDVGTHDISSVRFDKAFSNNTFTINALNNTNTAPNVTLILNGVVNNSDGGSVIYKSDFSNNNVSVIATTSSQSSTPIEYTLNGVLNNTANKKRSLPSTIEFSNVINNNISVAGTLNNSDVSQTTVGFHNSVKRAGSIKFHGNFSNNIISASVNNMFVTGMGIALNDQINQMTSVMPGVGKAVEGPSSIIYEKDFSNNRLLAKFSQNLSNSVNLGAWNSEANGSTAQILYQGGVTNNIYSTINANSSNTQQAISFSANSGGNIQLNTGFTFNSVTNNTSINNSPSINFQAQGSTTTLSSNSININSFHDNALGTGSPLTINFSPLGANKIQIKVNKGGINLAQANHVSSASIHIPNANIIIVP